MNPRVSWIGSRREPRKKYELKEGARLGPGRGDDKEARILNRPVRWTESGTEYEADPDRGNDWSDTLTCKAARR